MKSLAALLACVAVALMVAGCSDKTSSAKATTTTAPPPPRTVAVLGGENNRLWAYSPTPPFTKQKVIPSQADDPVKGLDINAQICIFRDGDRTLMIAGEDTDQTKGDLQGWGIFELGGKKVGDLSAKEVAKLVPTYQTSTDNPENYGCGVLSDGRLLTTDVGNQSSGQGDGQLIIWFPPFDSEKVSFCKLDTGLTTAQSIAVDADDNVYVATAFPTSAGIYKYTGPFPTSADAAGGCGKTDPTGAPMADTVTKSTFISAGENGMSTPSGLSFGPDGHLFASSVITGVINEYDAKGVFVRTILQPPAGEKIGENPFSTGTPLGLAVAPDGTLFYADIGIAGTSLADFGPKNGAGTVRRIVFVGGQPKPPETMASGYAFPDAVGVLTTR